MTINKYVGDGLNPIGFDKNFDLILCIPPYVPLYGRRLKKQHPAVGTHLMRSLIQDFWRVSNVLILGLSNVAEDEFLEAIKVSNEFYQGSPFSTNNDKKIGYKLLSQKLVPFRNAHISKTHLKQLIESKRVFEKPNEISNYTDFRYWHYIKVYKVFIS